MQEFCLSGLVYVPITPIVSFEQPARSKRPVIRYTRLSSHESSSITLPTPLKAVFTASFPLNRSATHENSLEMVLITIRAPIVNLIVTVICLVVEVAFLAAALWTFQFITCRRLVRQQSIRILSQKRVVAVIAFSATLMFVALETLISIFSEAGAQPLVSREDCIRNMALGVHTEEYETEGEVIHYGCMTINGTEVTHHQGNYSLETGSLTCGTEPLYSYVIGERKNVSWEEGERECNFRACSVVVLRGNLLYISERIDFDFRGEPIPAMLTDVTPINISAEDLKRMSNITISGYDIGIHEESDIRRRALAAPLKTRCDFERAGKQATTIPLSVIVISATVWLLSILFFLLSRLFKNRVFFNSSDPMHWASFTWHDVEAANGNDPQMTVSQQNGNRRIRITSYT